MRNFQFQISNCFSNCLRQNKFPISGWLMLIISLFLLTRLYQINSIPASLYWDEASIGYNAYSILKTGHDEWGQRFPIHFRAFGEFKLPVYIYSVVPSLALFGLNELTIRLPAVIFSLGIVILVYLISSKIFNGTIGLLAALLITIYPWFFIFSRSGYEATAGLMFYLLGIYSYLFVEKRKLFILLTVISFIFSMYSHNSFRVIIPLTIVMFFLFIRVSKKELLSYIFVSFMSIILFTISLVPILRLIVYDSGFNRISGISIIPIVRWVTPLSGKAEFQVIRPPSGNYTKFFENYASHFNPVFLFASGDKNFRSQQPGFGQLYIIDGLFLVLGLIFIRRKRKLNYLPVVLLLLTPIPAALTFESPHSLRTLAASPFLAMISAAGIFYLYEKYNKKVILAGIVLLYLILFSTYFYSFIVNYPAQSSNDWQYGYKQIFTQYKDQFSNYDRVFISDEYGQPYIFALTYLNFDPKEFSKRREYNSPSNWGFSTVQRFDKFEFNTHYTDEFRGKLLVFYGSSEKNIKGKYVGKIDDLSHKNLFTIYEINQD